MHNHRAKAELGQSTRRPTTLPTQARPGSPFFCRHDRCAAEHAGNHTGRATQFARRQPRILQCRCARRWHNASPHLASTTLTRRAVRFAACRICTTEAVVVRNAARMTQINPPRHLALDTGWRGRKVKLQRRPPARSLSTAGTAESGVDGCRPATVATAQPITAPFSMVRHAAMSHRAAMVEQLQSTRCVAVAYLRAAPPVSGHRSRNANRLLAHLGCNWYRKAAKDIVRPRQESSRFFEMPRGRIDGHPHALVAARDRDRLIPGSRAFVVNCDMATLVFSSVPALAKRHQNGRPCDRARSAVPVDNGGSARFFDRLAGDFAAQNFIERWE